MCCFQELHELPSTPTHHLPMARVPRKTCSQGQVVNKPPEHEPARFPHTGREADTASPCSPRSARGHTRLPDKRKTSRADAQQDCGPLCPPPERQMPLLHTRTRQSAEALQRPRGSSGFSPHLADSRPGLGRLGGPGCAHRRHSGRQAGGAAPACLLRGSGPAEEGGSPGHLTEEQRPRGQRMLPRPRDSPYQTSLPR